MIFAVTNRDIEKVWKKKKQKDLPRLAKTKKRDLRFFHVTYHQFIEEVWVGRTSWLTINRQVPLANPADGQPRCRHKFAKRAKSAIPGGRVLAQKQKQKQKRIPHFNKPSHKYGNSIGRLVGTFGKRLLVRQLTTTISTWWLEACCDIFRCGILETWEGLHRVAPFIFHQNQFLGELYRARVRGLKKKEVHLYRSMHPLPTYTRHELWFVCVRQEWS